MLCSCGQFDVREGQRNCKSCHASYMRKWRKTHPLNEEQKKKSNCRSYANVYQNRGKIEKQSCEKCGDLETEKHHDNYDKPLEIRWLCRKCHLLHHNMFHDEQSIN